MPPPSRRHGRMTLEEIASGIDEKLESGSRSEVIRLLALLAGRFAIAKIRARDLRGEDLGQPAKPSQRPFGIAAGTDRVTDRWITPRDAAARLGHCERWLRRRRLRQPYCSFCIPGDSGRGFRVSEKGLLEHMERERKRLRE